MSVCLSHLCCLLKLLDGFLDAIFYLHYLELSPFRPKFRSHCNEGHSLAHPRKPPYRHKNLVDISYTSRVIANCVSNFVAMATREGRK